MNQLTHWNPFKSLARSDAGRDLDQLFRDFGMRPFLGQFDVPDIRIDVSETDTAYTVHADIPGAKKDDIELEVDGRQVSITARSSGKLERKDETCLYSERSEGQVYRAFTLPAEVDGQAAAAKFADGVLTLTLPKKANGSQKRIKVS
jgi:HSP20 family protein